MRLRDARCFSEPHLCRLSYKDLRSENGNLAITTKDRVIVIEHFPIINDSLAMIYDIL